MRVYVDIRNIKLENLRTLHAVLNTNDDKRLVVGGDLAAWAIDDESVTSRSKGEWKEFPDEGFVECPFCEHATNCEDNIDELHFCFFCGAELKKGGAE